MEQATQSTESEGTADIFCVAHGVPFQLRADDAAILHRMAERVPFATRRRGTEPRTSDVFHLRSRGPVAGFQLAAHGEILIESADLDAVLDTLQQSLMVHVANFAPDRVFVHAGVVGWRGKTIVLPGPSFAGKTTLVAELVCCGATYYSDEYAVVDDAGMVYPYARELQMREPGHPEQRPVAAASLNGVTGTEPLLVSHVIFAEYRVGATWQPTSLSHGLAVLEMLRHTIPVQRTPARVMATLTRMVGNARVLSSLRGDAHETARQILAAIL